MRRFILISLFAVVASVFIFWSNQPTFANPDVAFDAWSAVGTSGNDDRVWTHTPVGTPRGIVVLCVGTGGVDQFISATYGGVSMNEVSGSPNVLSGGEGGNVSVFFLGSSIPTGAQTVSVSVEADGLGNKRCGAISLTASANTEVVDSDATINSDAVSNPSTTLSLGGRASFAAISFFSGINNVDNMAPLSNWTSRLEHDFGSDTAGWYTYDTIGTSDVTAGWTQGTEDAAAIAVAISEVQAVVGGGEEYLMLLES